MWAVDCFVLHIGSDGIAIRPQMKLGYQGNTLLIKAGLEDIRDGIAASIVAEIRKSIFAEGHSLQEVLKAFQRQDAHGMMDRLISLAPWLLSQIIRITGVDIPERCYISARNTIRTGVGVSAGACLGWIDTKGYRMLGVKGKVGALVKVGGDIMAGMHQSRRKFKAIIGVGSVLVELVFALPEQVEMSKLSAGDKAAAVADAASVAQTAAVADIVGPGHLPDEM